MLALASSYRRKEELRCKDHVDGEKEQLDAYDCSSIRLGALQASRNYAKGRPQGPGLRVGPWQG